MNVDQNLVCSFHILRAVRKMKWLMYNFAIILHYFIADIIYQSDQTNKNEL